MKTFKKIISRIISILFTVILVFGIFVVVKVVTTEKGKAPDIFGYSFFKVQSGSMSGTFEEGEIILVKKASPSDIKEGDIISFYSTDPTLKDLPNTHRVVEVNSDKSGKFIFTTKGDSNPTEDIYKVPQDRLIGIYQKKLNAFSKLFDLLQSRYSFFFVLVIPLAVIVALEFNNVLKLFKAKNEALEAEAGKAKDNEKNNK